MNGPSRPVLRVLSLGAGVQSTTLALMIARGDLPMIDCAIFADTGAEPASVYRHLDWLRSVVPFDVHTVSGGNIRTDMLCGKTSGRPPFHVRNPDGSKGFTNRQCTHDYKIIPITRKIREMIGLRPRQRGPKEIRVEQIIGISLDEAIRMKPSRLSYVRHSWPLIDLGMRRRDCLRWMEERQYPRPPKSACVFCPFHSDAMWREIKTDDPEAWLDAVEVDRSIRARKILGRGTPFLHASLKPLEDVDLSTPEERGQLNFFLNECEGMCGV